MVREIFNVVWKLALYGTFMMLCVLVARQLLKRMPRNLICLLWALLAIRLILPWSIPVTLPDGVNLGIMRMAVRNENGGQMENETLSDRKGMAGNEEPGPAAQPESGFMYGAAATGAASVSAASKAAVPEGEPYSESGLAYSTSGDPKAGIFRQKMSEWSSLFWRFAPTVWAIGAIVVCIYWILMDIRLKRRVREAVFVQKLRGKVRVMECDRIDTAFVLGVFRPTIYLPESLEYPYRKYVLLHEKTHLYRKDHIWKWAACLLLCIYWFHPLLWVCALVFSRDLEEACDEAVLKKLGAGGKLPYARAILHEADAGNPHWAMVPGFGEGNMKKRVKHVLDYRKRAAAGVLLTAVVILGACSPFFLEKQTAEIEIEADAAEPLATGEAQEGETAEKPVEETQKNREEPEPQSGQDEYGYRADYVEQNAWTVLPVEQEELTDPLLAADPYCAILRKNEGHVENVRLSYAEPVPGAEISSAYGMRQNPSTQEQRLHSGVDFAAPEGSAVLAAAPGVVVETGFDVACGNYAILRHENGDLTYYANCAEILAEQGDNVEAGEQIATVGKTGISTGAHLHFALSREGVFVDPFAESDELCGYPKATEGSVGEAEIPAGKE